MGHLATLRVDVGRTQVEEERAAHANIRMLGAEVAPQHHMGDLLEVLRAGLFSARLMVKKGGMHVSGCRVGLGLGAA